MLSYFTLVYAIAWLDILLIVRSFASASQADPTLLVSCVGLPMLIAPGVAGITVTALADGQAALALLIAPAFAPRFSLIGFAAVFAGFFEEFAGPASQCRGYAPSAACWWLG